MAYKRKERPGFLTMHHNRAQLKFLTDEECGKLYKALLDYSEYGTATEFDGLLAMAYETITCQIDFDKAAWDERCERNIQNRQKANEDKQQQKVVDHMNKSSTTSSSGDHIKVNQSNIDQSKVNEINIKESKVNNSVSPLKSPQGDDTQTAFASFWKSYPKKMGKKDAEKAFAKAIQRTDLNTMLAALEKQRNSQEWQRNNGQYIPYPATWLNGDRWADDLTTGGGTSGGPGSDPLGGLRIGLHL